MDVDLVQGDAVAVEDGVFAGEQVADFQRHAVRVRVKVVARMHALVEPVQRAEQVPDGVAWRHVESGGLAVALGAPLSSRTAAWLAFQASATALPLALSTTDEADASSASASPVPGHFPDYDRLFTPVPTANDAQYEGLRQLVDEKKPRVIGINESDAWNHADGITANEKRRLLAALGPDHSARVKSAEYLAVGWLEVKTPEELEAYRHVMAVAHGIIREAFSNRVITPGKTTAQDVAWWMRQRVAEKGLGSWFQPSITIWRQGANVAAIQATPILPGDMLHTDFGIVYLGFCTDTQHNAYILKPGETDAPAGLKAGLAAANRLQDLTMKAARIGRTGNQALAEALAAAKAEGLVPSIYCHAIGYHGHAAGSPIGMADNQQGIPVRGDYAFRPNTWDSIELNVTHTVPEWGNMAVRFALEEDAALLPDGQWDWIAPRQTEFHLVRP